MITGLRNCAGREGSNCALAQLRSKPILRQIYHRSVLLHKTKRLLDKVSYKKSRGQ